MNSLLRGVAATLVTAMLCALVLAVSVASAAQEASRAVPVAPTVDPAMFERLAEKFGLMAAVVAVVVLFLLGLIGLVLRALLKSQRRQETAATKAEEDRRAADRERDQRLTAAIDKLATAQTETRDAVTRQTAAQLASQRSDPKLIHEIVERLTAPDRLCTVCPLRDLPEEERRPVMSRADWCRKNYAQCLLNTARG